MGCLQCVSQTVKDLIELNLAVIHSFCVLHTFLLLHFSCHALFLLSLFAVSGINFCCFGDFLQKKKKKFDHPGLIFKKKARATKNQVGLAYVGSSLNIATVLKLLHNNITYIVIV